MHQPPRRVAILGGGIAGLAAAWRLTDPSASQPCAVTVYQRGGILGGKGASVRGAHDRIEEHGLHVWLGYYDNAFRLVRECYSELDRRTTRPDCPIRDWTDAFAPAPHIGTEDPAGISWLADFSTNDLRPGEPVDRTTPLTLATFVRRAAELLVDFYRSLDWERGAAGHAVASTVLAAARQVVQILDYEFTRERFQARLGEAVHGLDEALGAAVRSDPSTERLWHLFDIITSQLRGIIFDGLLIDRSRMRALNDIEYRDWLARNGAHPTTLTSPLINAMYGIAFSHRDGDRSRESFPADLGLTLASRMFFDYKGSLFWKMQVGMGEAVIAPIYEALQRRGVNFEFFHRVDALRVVADARPGRSIAVELGRQVDLAPGQYQYDPLVDVGNIPCFSANVDLGQVQAGPEINDHDLASAWNEWPDVSRVTLEVGRDFDDLILAIPVGMIELIAADLIDSDPRWRDLVEHVSTVDTRAMQLWLRAPEDALGWPYSGSTVTAHPGHFDTFASMSHLLTHESWPGDVQTVAYFCCTAEPSENPSSARDRNLADALAYIDEDLPHYYPGAYDGDGEFRWDLLAGNDHGARGAAALATQYLRANTDPSDRYVQALPGTDRYRLRPDDSGFDHLWLAGDWTDNGINAGCIEAAVVSGLEAANGILGLDRLHGITGIFD